MGDDLDRGANGKRQDSDGDSPRRPTSKLTSDDDATVIGICVGLLAMVTGALVFVVYLDLLKVLSHSWWTY